MSVPNRATFAKSLTCGQDLCGSATCVIHNVVAQCIKIEYLPWKDQGIFPGDTRHGVQCVKYQQLPGKSNNSRTLCEVVPLFEKKCRLWKRFPISMKLGSTSTSDTTY